MHFETRISLINIQNHFVEPINEYRCNKKSKKSEYWWDGSIGRNSIAATVSWMELQLFQIRCDCISTNANGKQSETSNEIQYIS